MFTGIVTDIGKVISLEKRGDLHARILTSYDPESIAIGASIACDGVCLTATARGTGDEGNWFDVVISQETIQRSKLSSHNSWEVGSEINLERSLRLGDEFGGHIVTGHVDGVITLIALEEEGESTRIKFEVPNELARFIASKGSVALNGVSLTVNEVDKNQFGINVIPHTKAETTWKNARIGDAVNLEIDPLARYVDRLREWKP